MNSLYSHAKIQIMPSGWYVVLENGEVYTEYDGIPWSAILKKASPGKYAQGIDRVCLKNRNIRVELQGKNYYVPPGMRNLKEITVCGPKMTTRSELVERFIGYYDSAGKVFKRVNIKTGKFRDEILPY